MQIQPGLAQSDGAVEYIDCISSEGYEYPHPPNERTGYNTKQSDGEALVIMQLWEMLSSSSLPSLLSPLWPGVVAPDRVK